MMKEDANDIEDGAVEHNKSVLDGLLSLGPGEVRLLPARRIDQAHISWLSERRAGGHAEDLLRLDRWLVDYTRVRFAATFSGNWKLKIENGRQKEQLLFRHPASFLW